MTGLKDTGSGNDDADGPWLAVRVVLLWGAGPVSRFTRRSGRPACVYDAEGGGLGRDGDFAAARSRLLALRVFAGEGGARHRIEVPCGGGGGLGAQPADLGA